MLSVRNEQVVNIILEEVLVHLHSFKNFLAIFPVHFRFQEFFVLPFFQSFFFRLVFNFLFFWQVHRGERTF